MITQQIIEVTATGIVYAGPCMLLGITGYATSDDVEITLHDNASAASGTVLDRMKVDFSVKPTDRHNYVHPKDCKNGIYLTISGTSPKIIVDVVAR